MASLNTEKEEILLLLEEHKALKEDLVKKNTWTKWLEKKQIRLDKYDYVTISQNDFDAIELKFGISFPEDIRYFYEVIGSERNDFYYQIQRILSADNQMLYKVQYTEQFAIAIIKYYNNLSVTDLELLRQEIRAHDVNGFMRDYSSELDYLLMEDDRFYNLKEHRFNLSVLQKVYESFEDKKDVLKHVFLTWIHCGGAGGVILNTEKKGYDGGMLHGDGLSVEVDGKSYTYNSNVYINREQYFLEPYKSRILMDLEGLRSFALIKNWSGIFRKLC